MIRLFATLNLFVLLIFGATAFAQETLRAGTASTFSLVMDQSKAFSIDLKEGQLADIRTDAKEFLSLEISVTGANGNTIAEHEDASAGYVFVAPQAGTYKIRFKLSEFEDKETASQPNFLRSNIQTTSRSLRQQNSLLRGASTVMTSAS